VYVVVHLHRTVSVIREYNFLFHCLYSPLGPWPLIFSFMIILQTVGLLGRVISSTQGLYLNTRQHKHNKHIHQTSMPCVGFEPSIPAPERAKTVHALDLSATVTGEYNLPTVISRAFSLKGIYEHVRAYSDHLDRS
jgi:hypothetical protein